MMGKIQIYACGGAGINLAMPLKDQPSQEGYADLSVCFIDTSRSNFPAIIAQEDSFVLPGADGSGKIRAMNYPEIANNVPQILGRFPTGDFNIVIHSASGGSGSVFGPLVASTIAKSGKPVVSLVVGSWESLITITNTINTLKSMDNIARTSNVPLVFSFFNNQDNSKRKDVDGLVRLYINRLACLVSGVHTELDSADISNWLRYDRNPNNQTPVGLAHLDIVETDEDALEIEYPISIASIHSGASSIGSIGADYQCAGIMKVDIVKAVGYEQQHYILSVHDVPELLKSLEQRKAELVQKQQARPRTQALVDSGTATTDDGMVL